MITNPHTPGRLAVFLVGDLGVARRHLARLLTNDLPPSEAVFREILRSVELCVERIETEVPGLEEKESKGE